MSVLKEEKRLILLQVKAGEAEKNKMVSQMKEDKLPKLLPRSHNDLPNGTITLNSKLLYKLKKHPTQVLQRFQAETLASSAACWLET